MAEFRAVTSFESNFVTAWEAWDEMGVGELYFYNVTLRPEYAYLVPEGTVQIGMYLSSQDGVVQFEFYSNTTDNEFTYRAFHVNMSLGEEKFYDDQV